MSNVKKDELQINLTELVKDKKKLFEKHFFAVRRTSFYLNDTSKKAFHRRHNDKNNVDKVEN